MQSRQREDCCSAVNLSRQFEQERARRTLLETTDPDQLRQIGLMLLAAWNAQQDTIETLMHQGWLARPD